MKMYYIETNGYMLVAATDNNETRCFIHDDPDCICYMPDSEKATAALEYLNQIDPFCFCDWDYEDADGNPYTIDDLTEGCYIIAELEV